MEFQSAQQPPRLLSRECLIECASRVSGEIIEDDANTLSRREVNLDEVAHAGGEIDRGSALGDFHLAPRPMDVDEHEQISGSIAPIFAVVAR
jgi:hypothetical protein